MFFFIPITIHILLHTYSHAYENYRLKIDYNERTDKQTGVRKLNITFLDAPNKYKENVIGDNEYLNIVNKENLNNKNPFDAADKAFADENIQFTKLDKINANRRNLYENPRSWNNKGDYDDIKNGLNRFMMYRRNNHFSTPKFNHPLAGNGFKRNRNTYIDDSLSDTANYYLRQQNDYYNQEDDINKEVTHVKEEDIISEITKQNKLIERIADTLLQNRKPKSEFEKLLESIEIKKTRTTTTTTEKLTTMTLLIDETEIRNALKNDPFVKRILKLAHNKRIEYKKNMGLKK
ncbi:unnamed protein product [Euphydryas editha]|uniref:Fam-b protein n=1 Tax=Euphydryas editha TaxID=104508 RepID=A0AAU9TDR1_EUPED|nr:unnamed protein product [Euphydryas editha]